MSHESEFASDGALSSRDSLPHTKTVPGPDMPQTVHKESIFRLIGPWGDNGIMAYELIDEFPVMIKQEFVPGTAESIQRRLSEIRPGNVVHARIQRDPDERWFKFVNIDQVSDSTLVYVEHPDALPGEPKAVWDQRDQDSDANVSYSYADEPGATVEIELQVQRNYLGTVDDDAVDDKEVYLWADSRKGLVSLEDFFAQTSAFEDGAHHMILAKPDNVPFIALYLFPAGCREQRNTVLERLGAQLGQFG